MLLSLKFLSRCFHQRGVRVEHGPRPHICFLEEREEKKKKVIKLSSTKLTFGAKKKVTA